jgi:uncharacterized membrane protein YdjX (TVP38/TMEM64 family)
VTDVRRKKLREVGLIVLVILLIPAIWAFTPVLSYVEAAFVWLREAGPAGMLVYVVLVALSGPPVVSAELMMAGGGFLYGPVWGTLLAWVGSVGAFSLNMSLSRTVLRETLSHRWRDTGGPLKDLDDRLASRGAFIVGLIRLPPLSPFHVVSYALGLTQIRLRDALIGTALGCVPQVAIFAALGSTASGVEGLAHISAALGPVGLVALGGVTVLVTVALTWFARRELRRISETGV